MKLKSQVDVPILIGTVLAAALVSLGIFLSVGSGEQSKLVYDGDLWCVSNFVEKEPTEYISQTDKRPKQDPLLDGKENWIVRDQVKADTAQEAESKVQKGAYGQFEPSDKTALRDALQNSKQEFFLTHFNQGATYPGPCLGTGWSANMTGTWLNDLINQRCNLQAVGTGTCETQTSTITRVATGNVSLPATGGIVEEDHLVTAEENGFKPSNITDGIPKHLEVTKPFAKGVTGASKNWTPAERGGQLGQGSIPTPPPAKYEPWIMNMDWTDTSRPAPGTRFVLTNKKTGKSIVAIAGYETGPNPDSESKWLMGAQSEAMAALGAQTNDQITVGLAKDQNLEPGPIDCAAAAAKAAAASGSGAPYTGDLSKAQSIELNVTMFSPNLPNNRCDSATGGDGTSSADGGFFQDNGVVKWHKGNVVLDHIFAEPQTNNIIPWNQIDSKGIVIPGLFNNAPIQVHDHYGAGVHSGQNFVDLLYSCNQRDQVVSQLKAAAKQWNLKPDSGGDVKVKAYIVDLPAKASLKEPNSSQTSKIVAVANSAKISVAKIWNLTKEKIGSFASKVTDQTKLALAAVLNKVTSHAVAANGKTVVIDPGHGTKTNTRGSREGATELAIGLRLKDKLQAAGYKVVMTRTTNGATMPGASNEDNDNISRAKIANDAGADLVLRLHSDDRPDDLAWALYPDVKGKDRTGHSGPPNDRVIPESKKFAEILNTVSNSNDKKSITMGESKYDRGTPGVPLLILSTYTNAPAVTWEMYGHKSDALFAKYKKPEVQDKMADIALQSINTYFGTSSTAASTTASQPSASTPTASNTSNPLSLAGLPKPAQCPAKALPSGPTAGKDIMAEIAHAFESSLSMATGTNDTSGVGPDTAAEAAIVEEAMKFAPNADGTTKYKYVSGGRGPNVFDCSGFVSYVLNKVKAAGANIDVGSDIYTRSMAKVGRVINQIDKSKFTLPSGGAKLRTAADLPDLSTLRPGDILFFGTATACSEGKKDCPNLIGHVGIYLGDGRYIHSTSSDPDPNRDSASSSNDTSQPPFTAHPQGAEFPKYNGVKISNLADSYFTPGLYIQVNRVTHDLTGSGGYNGPWGSTLGLGTTANPGGSNPSVSYKSCHGASACVKSDRSGHGVFNNRFSGGDAIDISPSDGICHAAFDGIVERGGSGRASRSVLTSVNGLVKAYYYHTLPAGTTSGQVKAGDVICRVGADGIQHIHFELLVGGKSVNGLLNLKSDEHAYMRSLWDNMKRVLGIT